MNEHEQDSIKISLIEDGRTAPRVNVHDSVMGAVVNEGRLLRSSVRLPMDEAIPVEQAEEVRSAFKAHTFAHNVSVSAAAKQIGYAASVISQWLDGKYAGDNDEVTRAVNSWLDADLRTRGLSLNVDYVPASVCEGMRGAIKMAHARNKMVACIMPSGTGKTMMIDMMSRELRGFTVYCHQDLTPRKFLVAVAKAVGAAHSKTARDDSSVDWMSAIVSKLRGSRRPIFLDEAHLLRRDVFARIRAIYDQTGVSIVMAGTEDILSNINDRAGGRGQMASRCCIYNALAYYANIDDPGRQTLGRPLYTKEEIRAFIDAAKVKIDPQAFELLWALACMPDRGCMRLVLDLVGTITQIVKAPRITREAIWQALEIYDLEARQPMVDAAKVIIEQARKVG